MRPSVWERDTNSFYYEHQELTKEWTSNYPYSPVREQCRTLVID
jgi:hypothetical protein